MKKYLTIILLVIAFPAAKGQTYHPMLGTSNSWYISSAFELCFTAFFSTTGDTSILGQDYKKVSIMNHPDYPSAPNIAYLREDTSQKKVYVRVDSSFALGDTSEFLFYDFTLLSGDSIFLYNPQINSSFVFNSGVDTLGWYIVDSVGTRNILAGMRKTIYLSKLVPTQDYQIDHMQWVESIGAINGPYLYFAYCMNWLSCEFRDTIHEYVSGEFLQDSVCDCTGTGINKILTNKDISIYPNPASGHISIDLNNTSKITRIALLTITGQKLKEEEKCGSQFEIDISNIPDGIYILTLQTEKNFYNEKIIITNK